MGRLADLLKIRGFRSRLAFYGGAVGGALLLIFLARFRPSWPWFSLWLFVLLGLLLTLSLPRVRRALNLSWFAVTLLMLLGVASFDLYLFHVETHRQRSERLEVRGVYLDPDHRSIRVGVGHPDLDIRLAGSPQDFDRWAVELRAVAPGRFVIDHMDQVYMVDLPESVWWRPWARVARPAMGARLAVGHWSVELDGEGSEAGTLRLAPEGRRGALVWNGQKAPLAHPDPLLDRRLSHGLSQGIPLSELDWDSIPDPSLAKDLILTMTRRGRSFGRIRISLPRYRLVSRSAGEALGPSEAPVVAEGDTVWVSSRGKRWAFALGRVPGVSRVAAPIAVNFVRRPRPTGWPLPSSEACGDETHRCAVISTRPLPPPQVHFDLSGFGLDTARYSVLARLETGKDGVRLVGAEEEARFAYGQIHPLSALSVSGDSPATGILVRVHRASQGQQSAVLITVLGLFGLFLGALATVSGNLEIWERRKSTAPSMAAAWAFVNVFLIFLGVRLALGLRVAYSPPFYDRAAATAVGLWMTFAVMLVALGRWSDWVGLFRVGIRWMERPFVRIFLPGVSSGGGGSPLNSGTATDPGLAGPEGRKGAAGPVAKSDRRRAAIRTGFGLVFLVGSMALLLWQRPESAASLIVAVVGIGAWLGMGLSRRWGGGKGMDQHPLSVITAEGQDRNPALSLALAAGGSVVLALAIHAPWMALVPVLLLLALFGSNRLMSRLDVLEDAHRRAWALFALVLSAVQIGVLALFPWPQAGGAAVMGAGLGGVVVLKRPWGQTQQPLLGRVYGAFLDLERAVFSGLGWVGIGSVVVGLMVLSAQAIPPFVRFALVFLLFLMAIRAGLACHRLLEEETRQARLQALGVLVIPLGVLLVFMLFDFGLGLVFFVPMFLTVLLAARIDRLPRVLMGGSVAVAGIIAVFAWSVLNPSVTSLRTATDVPSFSREFQEVGNVLTDVLRATGMGGPVTRASIRSLAASHPQVLEEALAFAGPSEALFAAAPSREQVWGGRAYAASDLTGSGFAGTAVLGRGVPTAVSYAENTYSVYVLSEHGALGGLAVLSVYLALLVVVGVWIWRVHPFVQETEAGLAVLAMTVGGVLWLTLPAVYVAASNLGLVPLTGQNMPFLGLNSWADVVLVSGLSTGMVFSLAALEDPHV